MKTLPALQQVDQTQSNTLVAGGGALLCIAAVIIAPSQIWLALLALAGGLAALAQQHRVVRTATRQLGLSMDRDTRAEVQAHDMRSALLSIEGGAAALRRSTTGPVPIRTDSIAAAIQAEIGRMRSLIDGADVDVDLTDSQDQCTVNATIEPILKLRRAAGHEIVSILGNDATVTMSSSDLGRCISNMIDNCILHAPSSGIEVSGFVRRGHYLLSVVDHGPGFLESLLDDAFEAGVSSRADGGLGLYSVGNLAEEAGGSVSIETSSRGTAVHLSIPVVARTQSRRDESRMSAAG